MYTNDQIFLDGNNGKAVLLIHGVTSGCAQMYPLANVLNEYGYAVRCVNIAGHGTYPQDLLHTSWENMIDKAEYDYRMLKNEYDAVAVGGLSLGGALSIILAKEHPDIRALLTISAPLKLLDGVFTQEFPPEQIFWHRNLGGKTGIAKKHHIHYEEIAVRVFKELQHIIRYISAAGFIEGITTPACIAQAKDDTVADPNSCRELYNRIGSCKKELYNPDTGGHNLCFGEERFPLFEHIIRFINGTM